MPQVISRILSHTCSAAWTSACFALLLAMPAQANEAGAPQPSVGIDSAWAWRQPIIAPPPSPFAPDATANATDPAACTGCGAFAAPSGDILLGQVSGGVSGGGSYSQPLVTPPPTTFAPDLQLDSFADPTACIGCSGAAQLPLNVATAANPLTTVITPADPGWNSFILALSDQKDSLVITSWCLYPTASVFSGCGKSGGGNPESLAFGAVGSFAGDTVDFVKVIITDASFTNTPTSDSESFYETFQFWGSGTPAPGPRSVPEPGILALLLPALAGLLLARRRRDGLPAVPQGLKSGE